MVVVLAVLFQVAVVYQVDHKIFKAKYFSVNDINLMMSRFISFLIAISFLIVPVSALKAQAINCGDGFDNVGGLCVAKNQVGGTGLASTKNIKDVIPTVIKTILLITGGIAVLFIIIGGFQYVTSGANPEGVKKGKATIVNAIIGLILILLSYVIVVVISNLLIKPGG